MQNATSNNHVINHVWPCVNWCVKNPELRAHYAEGVFRRPPGSGVPVIVDRFLRIV